MSAPSGRAPERHVRIIAGTARGRPLRAPPTEETRPTSDLIRGAIFSMLEAEALKRGYEPNEEGDMAAAIAWPKVLDLFAGSGALGIEALSRGAQRADFVEADPGAVRTIEANLRTTQLGDRARVHRRTVQAALESLSGPFDLVLLDPPYGEQALAVQVLDQIAQRGLVPHSGVIVLEQPASAEPPPNAAGVPLLRTRTHGRTRITVYAGRPAAD